MKFLGDENIGLSVIKPLRQLGIDITSIIEIKPGSNDTSVLELANRDKRVLITTDKDFGELVFAQGLLHMGIILLRLEHDSSKNKLIALKNLFAQHMDKIGNAFTVVTEGLTRIRPNKKTN